MSARSSRWLATRLIGALLGLGVVLIATTIVRLAADQNSGLGHDFFAYLRAARRLMDGSHLYLPELLAGETLTTSEFQYLYPPLLAQLLLPAALVPADHERLLFVCYTLVSAGLIALAALWAWRLAGGAATPLGALIAAFTIGIGAPFFSWITNGNASGLLAIPVVAAISGRALPAGVIGGAIKLIPGGLLLLVRRADLRTRGAVFAALLVVCSLLISPGAWASYMTEALPNAAASDDPIGLGGNPAAIARLAGTIAALRTNGTTQTIADLSVGAGEFDLAIAEKAVAAGWGKIAPVALLTAISELELPIRLAGMIIGVALLLRGAWLGSDRSRRHVAVAFLTAGPMLLPWAFWDHYLIPLLPIALMAWRLGDRPTRVRIGLAFAFSSSFVASGIGGYLWIPISLILLLDGIRRTRLPEPAADAR